jgi:hypothetical protein
MDLNDPVTTYCEMAISVEGTFHYVFEIQDDLRTAQTTGRVCDVVKHGTKRLIGHAPALSAVEYQREPWQLYARLTLRASDPEKALTSHASFSIDRALVSALRSGDAFYLARTGCGGLGLSIMRGETLVAAAGALASLPLGPKVSVRTPVDLVQQAERVFRQRDSRYSMSDCPVEISIDGETRILHQGRPRMGDYDVIVRHGFLPGLAGTDFSVSIERRGTCPHTAAHTTAQLFEEEGLQLSMK